MIWYIIKILKYNGIFAQLAAKREKGLKFATFANFAKSSQKFFYLSTKYSKINFIFRYLCMKVFLRDKVFCEGISEQKLFFKRQ